MAVTTLSIIGSDVVLGPNHHWLRRFIWLLLILTGLTLSTYQIIDRVLYYDSGPTAVSLEIRDNLTLSFPKIMLCNNSPHNRTWLEEKNLTESLLKYERVKSHVFLKQEFLLDAELLEDANVWYNNSRLDAAIRFDAIIRWNGALLEDSSRSRYLTQVLSVLMESTCYVFEPPDNVRNVIAGAGGGLHLYALTHRNLDPAINQLGHGYRLFVLSSDASHNVLEAGIFLKPGTFSNVPLKVREFNHLPIRLGGVCDEEQKESRGRCYVECVLETTFNHMVGCRRINPSSVYDPCPFLKSILAEGPNFVSLLTNATHVNRHCNHCNVRCHELEYETGSVSSNTLSVEHNYRELQQLGKYAEGLNLTPSELVSDVVGLKVYFPSQRYGTYTQMELYSFWALLCDMGGALGLFVGSAVFTIVEIIDIVLYRLCSKYK